MKINIKMLLSLVLLSAVLICCFAGNAYASNVIAMDLGLTGSNWPGGQVACTATVLPVQAGAYVTIVSELGIPGSVSGYTDNNGKFTAVFTIPDNALDIVPRLSRPGYIGFGATSDGAQALDSYLYISPKTDVPEFPSVAVPFAAVLGLVFIAGRRKM